MPCGDGMKVDSQEGLLAKELGKEINCMWKAGRPTAGAAKSNTSYTRTYISTVRHALSEEITARPVQSTVIIFLYFRIS